MMADKKSSAPGPFTWWEALAALVALGFYARTVTYGWVFEDRLEIVQNAYAHGLGNILQIFSNTAWAGSGSETYLYRPFLILSYALNHLISGMDPWSYHLVNLLLFAGVAALVVRVGRLLGLSSLAAGLAGILFAIHPIHVEVVAPVFGRRDLLAVLFSLSVVLLHQRAAKLGGWHLALPIGAFALALLSKEVAVVGVAFVAVYDWLVVRREEDLRLEEGRGRLYIGYLAVLLAYHAVRIRVTGGVGVPPASPLENPLVDAPILTQLATAVAVIGKGLALQLVPLAQSPDYSFNAIPLVESASDPRFLGSVVVLAVVSAWIWKKGRRDPVIPVLGLWYLAALLPTANLLAQVGTIFGERFLFFPSVAFCLAAGLAGAWILKRVPQVAIPVLALWMAGLSVQTLVYSRLWVDEITLFSAAVETVPEATKAHHQLGAALLRSGELGAALPPLRRALRIAPDNRYAARTLAQVRTRIRERYQPKGGGIQPPEPPGDDPEILHTLGQFSRESGDFSAAEGYWEDALALDSLHAPTLGDLGSLRFIQGNLEEAMRLLRGAVREDPGMAAAWFNLAQLHLVRGRRGEAVEALETFLEKAGPQFPPLVEWAQDTLVALRGY